MVPERVKRGTDLMLPSPCFSEGVHELLTMLRSVGFLPYVVFCAEIIKTEYTREAFSACLLFSMPFGSLQTGFPVTHYYLWSVQAVVVL